MDNDTKQHLKNLSIAAVSVIPAIGGPVSVLLDKYLPEYIETKRNRLFEELNEGLTLLQQNGFTPDIRSDRFASTFLKGVKLALEEYDQEKIDMFKNIILKASIAKSSDFDEETMFLSWARDLTTDQIRILKAIMDVVKVHSYKDSNLERVLFEVFPDVPLDYLTICQRDLGIKNLIQYTKGNKITYSNGVKTKTPDDENKQWVLTDIAKRFVSYIGNPSGKPPSGEPR